MARLVFTDSADSDSRFIYEHLYANAGKHTVINTASSSKVFMIIYAPFQMAARRPSPGTDIRIGIVYPYIALYKYVENDDTVTILRIVHGRKKISGKLLK